MSNFSKFSLCLILTVSIVLMRTPIFISAASTYYVSAYGNSNVYRIAGDTEFDFSFNYHVFSDSELDIVTPLQSLCDTNRISSLVSAYDAYTAFGGFYLTGQPFTLNLTVPSTTSDNWTFRYNVRFDIDSVVVALYANGASETYPEVTLYPYNDLIYSYVGTISRSSGTVDIFPMIFNSTFFYGANTFYKLAPENNIPDGAYWRDFLIRINGHFTFTFDNVGTGYQPQYDIVGYLSFPSKTSQFPYFTLTPVFNSGTEVFAFTKPLEIADYRFLDALKNIWSAINGSSTTGNLDQTIRQQVQQQTDSLENGYDSSSGSITADNLNDAIHELDHDQAFSSEYVDNLDSFKGFDFQENEDTLQAMKTLSDAANTAMNQIPLIRALVVGGITFFIVAVIIGIRRYI